MPSRVLNLRRPDVCCVCGDSTPAGTRAWWNATARTVTCMPCLNGHQPAPEQQAASKELDRGRAGASVGREYERRRASREARTRKRHPLVGGLLLALRDSPQHEAAFLKGELGETAVGRALDRRTASGPAIVLHDRRMPRGYGNIDHLVVAPSGVYVVDAKNIAGKVRIAHPLFGDARLMIAGRNRSKLLDGLDRQLSAVRQALAATTRTDVRLFGFLCFTKADLPLLGATARGHQLLHPRAVCRRVNRRGPLTPEMIEVLARELAVAFPSA